MLGNYYSWLILLAISLAATVPELIRGRVSIAIGNAMAISLLSATWVFVDVFGVPLEIRIAVAAILLTVFCVHPSGGIRFSWMWLDFVLILFFVVGSLSDLLSSQFGALTPVLLYGELLLPYFTGRFISMRRSSLRAVAPYFCISGAVISMSAFFECLVGQNLWEFFFAPVDDLVSRIRTPRYGIAHRAAGPTRHPIFLAVTLLLLIPWSVCLACRADCRFYRFLGLFGVFSCVLGIASTVSRGPLIASGLSFIVFCTIAKPYLVKWFFLFIACILIVLTSFWTQFTFLVSLTDPADVKNRIIIVEDKSVVYSGTLNRLWVWKIYWPLVIKGGPLGFGTEAVSSFPPNIPGLPASAKARETLGIVDNSYLLTGLRFGWIGLSLFLILIFGSIVMAIRLRRSAGMILYPDGPAFLTALASCLIGVSFVMLTVFSSFDFMFWVYFHCGIVAGLASLRDSMLNGDIETSR